MKKTEDLYCPKAKSGGRERFSTGAVRDQADQKPRPELISPFALERLAAWLRDGAKKYGDRNWEAGMPSERTLASLLRHILKFMQGERSEDHLAAIMCNAMFLLDLDEKVRRGILPKSLLNLPDYLPVHSAVESPNRTMSPLALDRLKRHLASGDETWRGLITTNECFERVFQHLRDYRRNKDHSVDHAAAALANLVRIVHIDEGVRRGLLPPDLQNLPFG